MASELSDVDLARATATTVSIPRVERANSFVLHAPLELIARLALLPRVSPRHRDAARERIADIGTQFDAFGPGVDEPAPMTFETTSDAVTFLGDAVSRGELDDADAATSWIAAQVPAAALAPLLGDWVVSLLAAAGHAPIFFANLPRVSPRGELPGALLRPLVRSLAMAPELRMRWIDEPLPDPRPESGSLFDTLAATANGPSPADDFIHPTMHLVDTAETATLLAPHTLLAGGQGVADASRAITRAAAWTMVEEPGEAAPYLWSHCLTMPHAVLALAPMAISPLRHLAVAATYVVGFRSAFSHRPLSGRPPEPVGPMPVTDAIATGQEAAAAVAWHTPAAERAALVSALVDRAAVHHDAHLVKYTLTCLDAAAADPEYARLYLAAAASLSGWWATAPADA